MKILIPCSKDYITSNRKNPFVLFIYKGLLENGFDVVCDNKELWSEDFNYDAVFFQWPEAVFDWSNFDVSFFEHKLIDLRKKNIKILATCHNLHAHNNNKDANKLYDILYSNADAIHHLGDYSYNLFKSKHPNCIHFVSQHPIFYDIMSMKLDKKKCREKLGLPINKKIILAFGAFRDEDEKQLFLSLRKTIKSKNVALVAPLLPTGRLFNGLHINKTIKCIYSRIKYKFDSIYFNKGFVDESLIPYYLTACDIVFIQRKEILNSGNLPLAFSAGKIVVGPKRGNVGDILMLCGNPCFDPENMTDVISKTELALEMSVSNSIGLNNYLFAQTQMHPHITNEILSQKIKNILNTNNQHTSTQSVF